MKAIHKSYKPLLPPLRRDQSSDEMMDEIHREKVRKAKPDTKGIQTPAAYSTRPPAMTGSKGLVDHGNHSVNTLKKKEELLQLARDIERIYQKILEHKFDYRRELWEDNWEKVKQMRDNISRHPQGVTNKQVLSSKALRSFWPLEPVASRIVQQRIDQKSYEIHLEKLSKVKPVVNTSIQTPAHTQHKLKKVEVLSSEALRSFWPLEPVASRIVQQRIDQKSYEIHLEKLSEVKPVVDTSIHTPAHCDRCDQ